LRRYGYTYRCQDPVPSPLPSNPIFTPGLPSRPNCSAGVAPSGFLTPCCSPWAPFSFSAARSFEETLANHSSNCSAKIRDAPSGSVVFECYSAGERLQSWFDDDWSTGKKASLADRLDLGGLAIWTAGNAPSGVVGARYWEAIADNYATRRARGSIKTDDSAKLAGGVPPPPAHCVHILNKACTAARGVSIVACDACTQKIKAVLHNAGCTPAFELAWCNGTVPPGPQSPAPPSPTPPPGPSSAHCLTVLRKQCTERKLGDIDALLVGGGGTRRCCCRIYRGSTAYRLRVHEMWL